jgi:hypothetical protein
MKKKLVSLILAVALIMSFGSVTAFASDLSQASKPTNGAKWTNTSSIVLNLTFSNGKANATGTIRGNSNVTSIKATYTLKVKNANGTYSDVHTWPTVTVSGRTLTFSDSTSATSGKTYRLYVSATVTASNGTVEYVTDYYEKKY